MTRVTPILQKGSKALEDLGLLKILQSEIKHELSNTPFQDNQSDSLGDFKVDWESLESQDVVLRRKCESGEEVAVSALLGQEMYAEGGIFPREVLMKVCVKKPSLSSVLQFDCGVCEKGIGGSQFHIYSANYLHSMTTIPKPSAYRGPSFSDLDSDLQGALKEYLIAKGIGENLTNFLLLHLHQREVGQYVNWLRKLESLVLAKGE
ncbi:unnamed protein product [Dovyalis caffra]|uniref:Mitochondrial glycoprotein n=1 Tax=Dovyalis caffra TaxID=77055 RepID=A0AAV1RZZ3_9ROSI|nr:unnamed protein product [Dovyalis caffra]